MAVETYELDEVQEETVEECAEARALIDELGLDGQKPKTGADSKKQRLPYRLMTPEERAVFKTLCPAEARLADYDAGPIPLRVLQIAAHAKPLFDELYVWHPVGHDKDPVLVGCNGPSYCNDRFILARWGGELDEWPALLKRAARLHTERVVDRLETIAKKVTRALNDACDGVSVEDFLERSDLPSFYY